MALGAVAAMNLRQRRRHVGRRPEKVGAGEGSGELHPLLVPVSPQDALDLPRHTPTPKNPKSALYRHKVETAGEILDLEDGLTSPLKKQNMVETRRPCRDKVRGHVSGTLRPTVLRPPASADLVVHQDLHDIHVALEDAGVFGFVRQQDKLDPQKRNEDEGGSDGPHVQTGLSLVGHPQFGDQDPNDVEQEEEVYLMPKIRHAKKRSSQFGHSNANNNKQITINHLIYRQLSFCQSC